MIYLFVAFELATLFVALYYRDQFKSYERMLVLSVKESSNEILLLQKKNASLMDDLERARIQRDGAMNDLRKAQEIIKAETELDSVRALCQEVRKLRGLV